MKAVQLASMFFLVSMSNAYATPAWMEKVIAAIEKPASLSAEQEEACAGVILTEINHHFKTDFTKEDISTVQMPNWDHPESGFIRGGGYNIHIVKTMPRADDKGKKALKPGRYTDFKTDIELGIQPSLHLPGVIDGEQMFLKSENKDADTVSYDFIAHSDSAYAFLPGGVFVHFIKDVLGAKTRNPCPAEKSIENDYRQDDLE